MKKLALAVALALAGLCFAKGFGDDNTFINEEIGGFRFLCSSFDMNGEMGVMAERGVKAVIAARDPVGSVIYLVPFASERYAAKLVKGYLALAALCKSGDPRGATEVDNLVRSYASETHDEFVAGGVIFCWTNVARSGEDER